MLRRRFGVAHLKVDDLPPRYNLCPGESIAAVVSDGEERRLGLLRWGLVPYWTKDAKIARAHINARAETVGRMPAFRDAFRRRRCLIPADGFYEWKREGRTKTPFLIRVRGGEPFAFAGLWERWRPPEGPPLLTCAILTCPANELVAPVHDRMPVILPPEAEAAWLDPAARDPDVLQDLLRPLPAETMEAWQVSPLVSSPRNDSPECIVPVEGDPAS